MPKLIPLQKISVIIPVFNGTAKFKKLVESLERTYSTPTSDLRFFFLDDGSTDVSVNEVYQLPFFSRSDVILKKRASNLGFIKTVNEAVSLAPQDSDLVLLNSDTQVWSRSFEKLQEVTRRHPKVASVTPLTNYGTIASLFRWPYGWGECDSIFHPSEIAEVIEQAAMTSPYTPAPTGVGFCMYITREAWSTIGELSEVFGKGYGEECDWCQRAIHAGFDHLICTETYVHHTGSASFSSEEKKSLIERNSRILEQRNPGYDAAVVRYVSQKPIKMECVVGLTRLVSEISKKREPSAQTFLFTLHQDPFDPDCGGTEKYVKSLMDSLNAIHPVFCLFRKGHRSFELRALFQGHLLIEESIHQDTIPFLLAELAPWIDVLHLNHLNGWPPELVDAVTNLPIQRKLMTLHDYSLVCPSSHLLKEGGKFCGVEADLNACNHCLSHTHGYWNLRMEHYRGVSRSILNKLDQLIFPSETVANYFRIAFGKDYEQISQKAQILPHDLAYIPVTSFRENGEKREAKKLVFIGHLAFHKGAEIIAQAFEALLSSGFALEIWGTYHGSQRKKVLSRIPVFSFRNIEDLKNLFEKRQPDLVSLPSICAETFSYILFEAVALGQVPLIVGPFGNPAQLVEKEKIGAVMPSAEAKSLLHCCLEVRNQYSLYLENAVNYAKKIQTHRSDYLAQYLSLVKGIASQEGRTHPSKNTSPSVLLHRSDLSHVDFLAREADGVFGKVAFQLQFQLRKHQRVERWIFQSAKVAWRFIQTTRHHLKSFVASFKTQSSKN